MKTRKQSTTKPATVADPRPPRRAAGRPTTQPSTRRARQARRRKLQALRAARAYKARNREALQVQEEQRRKVKGAPRWRRPVDALPDDPCGANYGSCVPADAEVPTKAKRKKRVPIPLRRAVRAEPDDRVHGPNRGGESARSWQKPEERSATRLPVDVHDFLAEED